MQVLVVDIGGSHIKIFASEAIEPRRLGSGRDLTPSVLVENVQEAARDWRYDVVSVGYPGAVGTRGPRKEPGNLGAGWMGFDFDKAFRKPVRVVNDAVMQALGGYDGGRMLFLGLGTGLGSALVSEHVVVPLELGNIPYDGRSLADRLGRAGLEAHGLEEWRRIIGEMTPALREALSADYVVLGGGNAKLVDPMPPLTKQGAADAAFTGGFRLWEELVEPHDRRPPPVWRVVR
jgi:polyphosphate glucokinase